MTPEGGRADRNTSAPAVGWVEADPRVTARGRPKPNIAVGRELLGIAALDPTYDRGIDRATSPLPRELPTGSDNFRDGGTCKVVLPWFVEPRRTERNALK